jgi:hypothetical protein
MPYLKNKPVDEVRQFLQPYSVTIEILHAFPQPLGHRCEQCVVIDQRPLEGSLITLTPSKKTIVQLKVGSAQFSS